MADYVILPRWTSVANLTIGDQVFNGFRWLSISGYVRTLDRITVTYAPHSAPMPRPETSVTYSVSDRLYARRVS